MGLDYIPILPQECANMYNTLYLLLTQKKKHTPPINSESIQNYSYKLDPIYFGLAKQNQNYTFNLALPSRKLINTTTVASNSQVPKPKQG